MARLVVYVDGFNLFHGLKAKFGRRLLWLDLVGLAASLRPRSDLVAVKYFTAPVLDDPAGASRQASYQRAMLAHGGGKLEITNGRYQKKPMTCRSCGSTWVRYEEKETDVNIAVSLVSDAAAAVADDAILISADSDLVPAIRTARALQPDMFIAAAFPPKRYSAELNALLPASFHLGRTKLTQNQLPDRVTDAAGQVLRRPDRWR